MTTDIPREPAGTPLLDATLTINEVLQLHPPAVAVFNALAIDACCGGERPLRQAAREDGIALDALLAALRWSMDDDEVQP